MNNLRKIRRLKDMSQYELGRRTKLAQSVLSLIENGFKDPDKRMKTQLSRALECTVEEVFPAQDEG